MTLEWSWKQLEALFAAVHEISPESRPAFNAKLRHLQRSGVLPDTRTGRGKAASYGALHVVRVGFALELVQLGMRPDHVTAVLQRTEPEFLAEVAVAAAKIARGQSGGSKSRMLMVDPRGLSYLQTGKQTNAVFLDSRRVGEECAVALSRFSALILDKFIESLCAAAASTNICKPDDLALALTLVADPQGHERTR